MAWVTPSQKVRMAMGHENVNQTELARRLSITRPVLTRQLNNDTIAVHRLREIAEALGAELEISFIFPDGTRI